jgi:hypothetical protein
VEVELDCEVLKSSVDISYIKEIPRITLYLFVLPNLSHLSALKLQALALRFLFLVIGVQLTENIN